MSLEDILDIAFAFRKSKALLSAAELGLFGALADHPENAEGLSKRLRLHGRGVRDFLDTLVALKLLDRDSDDRYSIVASCRSYLDPHSPDYIGDLLEYLNARMYRTWSRLSSAIMQGKPQCGPAAAGGFPDFYSDENELKLFLKGMTGGSRSAARSLAKRFPWQSYRTVIDVGTAQGSVPVEIATAHPHLTGGGFDLPNLRPAFDTYVAKYGLDDRLQFYPGNFLDDPLPNANVLIMGRVLHDWDLTTRKMLLAKAFEALSDAGVLIIQETFIDEGRRDRAHSLLSSLNMLLQTDEGAEFSENECIVWMRETGFEELQVLPLDGKQMAVVGKKP